MAINRMIEHGKRGGFSTLCPGGLRLESFPMRLFRKGNAKFWDPAEIDFSRDAEDFAAMTDDEKLMAASLASRFMAGEESVTQDIQPFMHAMAVEGRLADEMYLTQFAFEEAKHTQGFRMWCDAVGLTGDLHEHTDYGGAYDLIFREEQPRVMWALLDDPSPAAQIRASVTYNHIVEGCLALTGYYAWAKVCEGRGLLPGMRQLIKHISDDERRHMAWGTFTCRRHVAADDRNWAVVEEQMAKLMGPALELTEESYERYEGRPVPFGIDRDEMRQYAADKLSRRLESIQGARGRDPREIDEDYSPMELEDRFGEEDAARQAAALAGTAG